MRRGIYRDGYDNVLGTQRRVSSVIPSCPAGAKAVVSPFDPDTDPRSFLCNRWLCRLADRAQFTFYWVEDINRK
jgi:hypothetical protein